MTTTVAHPEAYLDDPAQADALAMLAEPEYRGEGPLKVTGAARYTADLWLPGMLRAAYLRSPHPHARIVAIETAAARQVPGVHAVLTGADLPRSARFGRRLLDWPVLAHDRVRFVGDRVAAVAAESEDAAAEAIRRIQVTYAELPAILDPDDALAPGAPVLHPDAAEYVFPGGTRGPLPHPNLQGYRLVQRDADDIEALFAGAHRVFEHTFTTPRAHQGFVEPHACVVWLEPDGTVRVVATNKMPFALRQQMAAALGLPEQQIVVDCQFIGGDFGGKGLSLDEYTCYYLARATGRPVKAVMTYVDELQASNSRHAARIHLKTAVDAEGRFLAHQARLVFDGGAYAAGKPVDTLVVGGAYSTLGAYRVPHARIEALTVYTNTIPAGHMRAPGETQALFAGESHVDLIAAGLGLDPLELRRRNALRDADASITGGRFHEHRALDVLDALARETHWGEPLPPGLGRGLALWSRHVGVGRGEMRLQLLPNGTVEVLSGQPDQGAGSTNVIRRVAAATLSVDPDRVVVRYGDTATAPTDPGIGGNWATHVVGRLALDGARQLKQRLEDLAAEALGWPAGQVSLQDDRFTAGDESADFADVAARLARGAPVQVDVTYNGFHGPDQPGDHGFGAYCVEVEVDRATGQVKIRDVVLAADVGAIVNPTAHQGQLEGGFVYGLGSALMEELPVEDGRVTVGSLGDYKLPTEMDLPPFRTVLVRSGIGPGPFGAKAAGELTNVGVAAALANAVAAATGARLTTFPATPERILAALEGTSQR